MNDLQHELDAVEKRTRRYWFEDGIVEMASGIVLLLTGAWFVLAHAWHGPRAGIIPNLAFPALLLVLVFACRRVIRAAKDRYVHPRTGFVSFEHRAGPRWARAALAAAIAMLVTLLVARAPLIRNWILALEGTVFALAFLYYGRKFDILRFSIEGLLCAVAGLVVSVIRVDEDLGIALLFAWLGLEIAAGGALAFTLYLRRLPPREQA